MKSNGDSWIKYALTKNKHREVNGWTFKGLLPLILQAFLKRFKNGFKHLLHCVLAVWWLISANFASSDVATSQYLQTFIYTVRLKCVLDWFTCKGRAIELKTNITDKCVQCCPATRDFWCRLCRLPNCAHLCLLVFCRCTCCTVCHFCTSFSCTNWFGVVFFSFFYLLQTLLSVGLDWF